MHSSAKVSVVIPCFNHGAFLTEAIESALAQDGGHVEIVVVDDGSTDETARVLERYPRLRVLRRDHGGVSSARNAGLAVARGDCVVFLDADDRLVPGAIAATRQVLLADPECAWAAGHHRRIDVRGGPLPGPPTPTGEGAVYERLLRGNFVHTATVMFRRQPLEAAGGFDPRLEVCEDWDLYLRLARVHPARLHDQVVAEYRHHVGQTTARSLERLLASGLGVLRAQRPSLAGRRERAAWRDGMQFWREYYGDLLFAALHVDLRDRRFARAAWRTAVLGRHAPVYTVRRVARALLRRVGGRREADPERHT